MGLFSIFKRKKENEFAETTDTGFNQGDNADLGTDFNSQPDFGHGNYKDLGARPSFPEPAPFPQPSNFSQGLSNTEIQLILAKLDVITQRLEAMDRRLQIIEDIAKNSK